MFEKIFGSKKKEAEELNDRANNFIMFDLPGVSNLIEEKRAEIDAGRKLIADDGIRAKYAECLGFLDDERLDGVMRNDIQGLVDEMRGAYDGLE
jgi:hypothetical protein